MTDEIKRTIDNMNYKGMLQMWRFELSGHPYFEGEVGIYFSNAMRRKKEKLEDGEHTRISKEIGWDG